MNIVIIGMRGAGKSNVSRRLSVLVKRPVFATDDMIVYENGGKSIDDIIADNNGDWFQFRDLEFDTVKTHRNCFYILKRSADLVRI